MSLQKSIKSLYFNIENSGLLVERKPYFLPKFLLFHHECLSDFFIHLPGLLFVPYKIAQSVQEGLTYLQFNYLII